MASKDYLPRQDNALLVWASNFVTSLKKISTQIQFPDDLCDHLETLSADFGQKLQLAEAPDTRTKAAVQRKNDARKILERTLRQSIREYLAHNHFLTNPQRENLQLPIYKTTRTHAPIADTYPHIQIDSGTIRRLIIYFHDQSPHKSKAKPAGQHGVEIRWMISDVPIVNLEELKNSSICTKPPFMLEFKEHDRGKLVYFCLRWENTRGEKGPWSELETAFIP
ncbi:MAG: hypothetical protein LBI18_08405 [Planctomycetaceae bacterium]|jgi:hypothetical protein|nr:hypothetical protein [Planctomycetaceae bacterium]